MASILKIEQTDVFSIVRALMHQLDANDPHAAPQVWEEFEKYSLAESFWRLMHETFGYQDDEPSLKTLLMRLMVTDFARGIDGPCPKALVHLVLPKPRDTNAVVCLGQWRDSAQFHASYDRLSSVVADIVKLDENLRRFGD